MYGFYLNLNIYIKYFQFFNYPAEYDGKNLITHCNMIFDVELHVTHVKMWMLLFCPSTFFTHGPS